MSNKSKLALVLLVSKLPEEARLMYDCDSLLRKFNCDRDLIFLKLEQDDKNTISRLNEKQSEMSEEEIDIHLNLLAWNDKRREFLNSYYDYKNVEDVGG